MMGSGLQITGKSSEKIGSGKEAFLTNMLCSEKGDLKNVSLYSYKAGGLYTDNFYLQQIYLAFHQMFARQIPGATIRVSMPVVGDETKTLATLKSFLAETVVTVDKITKK